MNSTTLQYSRKEKANENPPPKVTICTTLICSKLLNVHVWKIRESAIETKEEDAFELKEVAWKLLSYLNQYPIALIISRFPLKTILLSPTLFFVCVWCVWVLFIFYDPSKTNSIKLVVGLFHILLFCSFQQGSKLFKKFLFQTIVLCNCPCLKNMFMLTI